MQKAVLIALVWLVCWCMTPQSQATMLISSLPFNGVWQGGAYGDEQTHQFQYCSAGASYRSGITMLVTITRNLGWGLAFGDQEWSSAEPRDSAFDDI